MIRNASALGRPRVSFAVAMGSVFGALYHGAAEPWRVAVAAMGAFVLCAACSALNQIQERSFDERMERTRSRPLPAGRIPVRTALFLGLAWLLLGLTFFSFAGEWRLLAVGVGIVAVYNGVYTPLKRVTPAALLVGGLAGAVPPLTGWIAAGGGITEPQILAVTGIFYLWQVPHFWLLAEKHRRDYRRAGFALMESALPSHVCSRLMILWVGAYFIGLGCFAGLAGPDSIRWLTLPALLVSGISAMVCVGAGKSRFASAAVSVSLPMGLFPLLLNIP